MTKRDAMTPNLREQIRRKLRFSLEGANSARQKDELFVGVTNRTTMEVDSRWFQSNLLTVHWHIEVFRDPVSGYDFKLTWWINDPTVAAVFGPGTPFAKELETEVAAVVAEKVVAEII